MSDVLLKAQGLTRTFTQGGESLTVLHNADFQLEAGEIVALVGPSGAGKSTMLQLIGLLDQPSAGTIMMGGKSTSDMSERERTKMRGQLIGFVYQFHYLLPEFTALENVVLPQMINGVKQEDAEKRAKELLDRLKLSHRYEHRPARLSGGEQQRVAMARALANNCKVLLADEPTGNLDPETSDTVFDLLIELVKDSGIGALIATHNMALAERMDRILELKGGRIISY